MKSIKNAESNVVVAIIDDRAKMLAELKAAGVRFGKTSLDELLDGKRDVVNGFSIVELVEAGAEGAAPADEKPADEQKPVENAPAPAPAPTDAAPQPAPAPAPADQKPLTPEPTKTDRAPRARAGIKGADPKGKIKPVRKGTKIADGLEMLLKGATEAELKDADLSDDIVDFVNRRVTKRGYGIKLADGKVMLVLPEGAKGIVFTNEPAEEKPAAAAPAPTPAAPVEGDKPAETPAPADPAPAAPVEGDKPAE